MTLLALASVLAASSALSRPPRPTTVYFSLQNDGLRAWNALGAVLEDTAASPLWSGVARETPHLKRNALCDHEFDLLDAQPTRSGAPFSTNAIGLTWRAHSQRYARHLLPSGILLEQQWRYEHVPWGLLDISLRRYEVPGPQLPGAEDALDPRRKSWAYVNLDGTPDQRHLEGNTRVDVYAVWALHLKSEDGDFDELLTVGHAEQARKLRSAILEYIETTATGPL